ncbi:cytochrome b5 reductase [Tieghemostelium lacteum]|uniref:Cytochrome b5 reductase n=1 Tax=Tieghemostelium lacteum TaxID=361077 RepID=A0A152A4Y2_TIELA|nr:cytochrome b5 reductase [Tieghemostelium lacteum]|eukprot:KYR01306.1 cytochrome b5 reductase [Tieghemostelium lacteum]
MSYVPIISDFIIKLSDKTYKRHEGKIGQYYTTEEVSLHNKKDDFWCIVHSKVYDLTDYLLMHPGGAALLFKQGGKDATQDFEGMFHSRNAKAILEKFYIGKLISNSQLSFLIQNNNSISISNNKSNNSKMNTNLLTPFKIPVNINNPMKQILKQQQPNQVIITTATKTPIQQDDSSNIPISKIYKVKLLEKEIISQNSYCLWISIPESLEVLNWVKPLTHVSLSTEDELMSVDNNNISSPTFRSYTPIDQSNEIRALQFLIKSYENGMISKKLCLLEQGDTILLRGPIKTGNSSFKLDSILEEQQQQSQVEQYLLMIAGGSGITPMLQTIINILEKQPISSTSSLQNLKILLLYSNSREIDIIYKNEIISIQNRFPSRFICQFILTKQEQTQINIVTPTTLDKTRSTQLTTIPYQYGRITKETLTQILEGIPIVKIKETLVCGPFDFNSNISNQLLQIGIKCITLE